MNQSDLSKLASLNKDEIALLSELVYSFGSCRNYTKVDDSVLIKNLKWSRSKFIKARRSLQKKKVITIPRANSVIGIKLRKSK